MSQIVDPTRRPNPLRQNIDPARLVMAYVLGAELIVVEASGVEALAVGARCRVSLLKLVVKTRAK